MNTHLNKAKEVKDDEFYTPYDEIEIGVAPFKSKFLNKVVYCNCDDKRSNFYKYFKTNFRKLGLKKLYVSGIHSKFVIAYNGVQEIKYPIKNGDYKCPCLTKYINACDIIVTNPPFSIFREYFDFIFNTGKKFLLIAPLLSMGYKDIFPLISKKQVNVALEKAIIFLNGKSVPIIWLTNWGIRRPEPINTGVKYSPRKYKKYDNIPRTINVDKVNDIPMDYKGSMGVPITYLPQWNPKQYELLKRLPAHDAYVKGKRKFARMFIRKK